jgi:hypothetical protein
LGRPTLALEPALARRAISFSSRIARAERVGAGRPIVRLDHTRPGITTPDSRGARRPP